MLVYLAGPINGCSDEEVSAWRRRAALALCDHGAHVLDPSSVDWRGRECSVPPASIVEADLRLIQQADVVLAGVWRDSAGTSMELWHATQVLGKPAVVWSPRTSISPWISYCAHSVHSDLDKAISACLDVLRFQCPHH